ncbi:MAG: hypothetical protein MJ231_08250 [bacterium]|nr:hypothetical protein [bacterium]
MLKINPETKLPYNFIKGSVAQRTQKVRLLNKGVYNKICSCNAPLTKEVLEDAISNNLMDLTQYRKGIIKVKPKTIAELPVAGARAYAGADIDTDLNISCYTINVPFNKDGILTDLSAFMHELTHVHQELLEPKVITRDLAVFNQELNQKSLLNCVSVIQFFYKYLYKTKPLVPNGTDCHFPKTLAGIDWKFRTRHKKSEDKINILQFYRYKLNQEKLAYEEQIRYTKGVNEEIIEKAFNMIDKQLGLSKAQEFVENKLKKELKKARK